jgi:dolichol kinase
MMPMISSDSDNAPGTVYYGISMSILALIAIFVENFIFAFGIGVLCTSLGDGFAGVIGSSVKKYNPVIYKSKTLFGTISAFLVSFISVYLFSEIYKLNIGIVNSIYIAIFAAGLELITGFGLDNIYGLSSPNLVNR